MLVRQPPAKLLYVWWQVVVAFWMQDAGLCWLSMHAHMVLHVPPHTAGPPRLTSQHACIEGLHNPQQWQADDCVLTQFEPAAGLTAALGLQADGCMLTTCKPAVANPKSYLLQG
jgi:hypothetical protein